ncbi:OmpH family outer membrane protein [Rhodopila sp.]|uniref:OmpH family outer membrane protein n=1 Tax=Rhodopila sp. TaxID=2480087 RepID=UPI002C93DD50|nr:OmpH family outer membrane protein [Rhodopila sp.]HVZ07837.1 OmpH family outer membrane protein [Rhodopila sp.]
MISKFVHGVGAAAVVALLAQSPAALAQQGGGWFVPNQPKPPAAAPRQQATPRPAQHVAPAQAQGTLPLAGEGGEQGLTPQQLQMQLPPAPDVPPMAKGSPTPAAIVGILSVPDVLRVSTAYQNAYKELNSRAQKLNEDAQKEQATLRDMGQAFANERAKLSPEQIRAKEREIQDRATEAQRKFGERNRIIQEAGQYVMAQINRTMEQVAQQVALSRGVNLVLNRAQILGTTADFDLTPAVAEVLNKVLPSVVVPPDGVSVMSMTPPKPEEKPAATPAAAPGAATTSGTTAAPSQAAHPATKESAKPAKKP